MGINKYVHKYELSVLKDLGLEYNGVEWCELGNQRWWSAKKPAKRVYESLGVKHTSIDINGRDEALKLDLDQPVPAEMHEKFDVVTNYGTLEHVNNQYMGFWNMHFLAKIGGLMLHGLPMVDSYKGHCRYYYTEEFVKRLAERCGYKIHDMKIMSMSHSAKKKNLLLVTLVKGDNKFVFDMCGIFDSGDLRRTGDYK